MAEVRWPTSPRKLPHEVWAPSQEKDKDDDPTNGNCDNCVQLGHAWKCCPRLDEAGKAVIAQCKVQL